jgi:hypothetical protein
MLNLDEYLGKGRQAGEEDLDLDAAPGQFYSSVSVSNKADVQHPLGLNLMSQPCPSLKLWVSLPSDARKLCWLLVTTMRIPQ